MKKLGSCTLLAWVVWLHSTGILRSESKERWSIMGSYDTKQECDSTIPSRVEFFKNTMAKEHPEAKITVKGENTVETLWPEGTLTDSTLICLPDTIDPRPRAKP